MRRRRRKGKGQRREGKGDWARLREVHRDADDLGQEVGEAALDVAQRDALLHRREGDVRLRDDEVVHGPVELIQADLKHVQVVCH